MVLQEDLCAICRTQALNHLINVPNNKNVFFKFQDKNKFIALFPLENKMAHYTYSKNIGYA